MIFPERYRAKHPLDFKHKKGDPFGWFMIPSNKDGRMIAVQADATHNEWEHISCSMRNRCPTWEEMCYLKNLFWDESQIAVQFHPAKEDYVNVAKFCLHIWVYKGFMPRPKKNLVG